MRCASIAHTRSTRCSTDDPSRAGILRVLTVDAGAGAPAEDLAADRLGGRTQEHPPLADRHARRHRDQDRHEHGNDDQRPVEDVVPPAVDVVDRELVLQQRDEGDCDPQEQDRALDPFGVAVQAVRGHVVAREARPGELHHRHVVQLPGDELDHLVARRQRGEHAVLEDHVDRIRHRRRLNAIGATPHAGGPDSPGRVASSAARPPVPATGTIVHPWPAARATAGAASASPPATTTTTGWAPARPAAASIGSGASGGVRRARHVDHLGPGELGDAGERRRERSRAGRVAPVARSRPEHEDDGTLAGLVEPGRHAPDRADHRLTRVELGRTVRVGSHSLTSRPPVRFPSGHNRKCGRSLSRAPARQYPAEVARNARGVETAVDGAVVEAAGHDARAL